MPLRVSSNNKGTWITWENPDESQSATFRIKPDDPEDKILAVLVKATTFIAKQMGEINSQILELEAEIRGSSAPTVQAGVITGAAPPGAVRIPMMSPESLSDAPADGGPVHFGWGDTPRAPRVSSGPQVPGHLAGEWEIIQPGEE